MTEQEQDDGKLRSESNERDAIEKALEAMKKAAPEIDRHVRERNALTFRARFIPPRAPKPRRNMVIGQ